MTRLIRVRQRPAVQQQGRRRAGATILHDLTAATLTAATACSTAPGTFECRLAIITAPRQMPEHASGAPMPGLRGSTNRENHGPTVRRYTPSGCHSRNWESTPPRPRSMDRLPRAEGRRRRVKPQHRHSAFSHRRLATSRPGNHHRLAQALSVRRRSSPRQARR
jgi:hypothetical protein